LILNAMRAGAAEYLYPPFTDALRAALERVGNERHAVRSAHRRGGRVIGFVSAKGGCGATTIACHTAAELPSQTSGKVLIADLDCDAGLISFLLKSKSVYNISDAARNTHRLDENYWRALVSNGIAGLEVITAPAISSRISFQPDQLRNVLSFIRTLYDWIVLDLGRGLNGISAAALEETDELFLVTTMEVPALHQAKMMAQKLLDSGYRGDRLHLLLNRTPKRLEVTPNEIEGMLGLPIYSSISNDFPSLNDSYSEGKLVSPATNLGRQFAQLASKIAGVDQKTKKKFSFFG
jgi:pilus assembly protein CpaE